MSNVAVPSDYLTPGVFVKVNFNQGKSNAGEGARSAIYIGPMTSTGTATVNTVYTITTDAQAKTLFGARSPLRWAIKAHLLCWPKGKLYALPYAASSGGSPVTASTTITYATTAAGPGYTTIKMFGEERTVGIKTGDTPTVIASAVSEAINGMDWPVTASPSSGVVTVSAPVAGVSSNGIYRITGVNYSTGSTAVATTCTVAASTLGSGADGTTTELANLATALAVIVGEDYYYRGITYIGSNATAYAALKTHVTNTLATNLSNRCRGFCASNAAKATMLAASIAVNHERVQMISEPSSEYDPAYLLGQVIGFMQAEESFDTATNVTNGASLSGANWHLKPVTDIASRMTASDINDMMRDGLTAIRSIGNRSILNASLTTRSKDATGLIDDLRAFSSHTISVADEVAARIEARSAISYAGFKLKDDERLSDGSIDPAQEYKRRVLTPSQYKSFMVHILNEFDDESKIAQLETAIIPSITCGIDALNVRRLEAVFDLRVIDILMQIGVEANEITPG